jgi:hypothetical protein
LLERFPNSDGVLLDVSEALLAQNTSRNRKQLVKASVSEMAAHFNRKFDLITINWLLHHLVGQTYKVSHYNATSVLKQCHHRRNPIPSFMPLSRNAKNTVLGGVQLTNRSDVIGFRNN